jgi:hypothetical protein
VNYADFHEYSTVEKLRTFAVGIQFDFFLVLIINSIFILLFLFPSKIYNLSVYQFLLKGYYVFVNAAALLLNLFGTNFYHSNKTLLVYDNWYFELHSFFEHIAETNLHVFLNQYLVLILSWVAMLVVLSNALWFVRKRTFEHKYVTGMYKVICAVAFVLYTIVISINLSEKPGTIASLYSRTERKLVPVLVNNPYLIIRTIHSNYIESDDNWDFQQFNSIRSYSMSDSNQISHIRIFIVESDLELNFIRKLRIEKSNLDVVELKTFDSQNNSVFQYLDEILIGIPGILSQDFYQSVYSLNRFESLPQIFRKMNFSTGLSTFNIDKKEEKLMKNFYCFDLAENADIKQINLNLMASRKDLGNKDFQVFVLNLSNSIDKSTIDGFVKLFNSVFDSASKENLNIVYEIRKNTNKTDVQIHKNMVIGNKNIKEYINQDSVICQSLDVLPTILHLLHYNKPFISFGYSILSGDSKALVCTSDRNKINLFNDSLLLSHSDGKDLYLRILKDSVFSNYDFKDSLVVEKVQLENIIHSIKFDFYQRLKQNSMIIEN